MNKAVFLDRDGVVNKYERPINQPEDLELFPWTTAAIKKLNQTPYDVYIVTNQGGIECGYFTEDDLQAIHDQLEKTLIKNNAWIDDIEYCPHFSTSCDCRKPNPGMLYKLADKYGLNLQQSYLIGDRNSDIIAGNQAGCTTIKLGANYAAADYTTENLADAVDLILKLEQVPLPQ